jgi:type I restriction enzyme S subunit
MNDMNSTNSPISESNSPLTINNSPLKKGYKQTEVGMIPEDWEVKCLNQISTIVRGGSPRPAGSSKYFNGNFIPWLTVASLTNVPNSQIFVYKTETFLTEEGSRLSRQLDKGTLIISNSGATLGVAKLLRIKCCANDGVAALQSLDENIYPIFIVYNVNAITKKLREDIATGNGQPNLNTELIGKIKIAFPPTLTEQKAIATALNDVDALISSLEQLITKKKAIKQGAMQELLIEDKFWIKKSLLELAENKKELFDDGDWIESEHITNKGIRLIQTGNIGVGRFIEKENKKYISEDSFQKLNCKKLEIGDVLICRLAEPAGRACIFPYIGERKVITSVDVTIFRPDNKKVNREFLNQIFSTKDWFKLISEKVGGTTHKRISRGSLGQISVFLPPLQEQIRIAQILSDMDLEIASLEAKKEKYQGVKQGMMQELLTGKTRLV